jgi:NodT family efflux transporter outer membrane factor (OMF) lipoprotein
MRKTSFLLLGVSLLTGCTVGPDFKPPAAVTVARYTSEPLTQTQSAAPAQNFEAGKDIPAEWWALFQSPALDQLIRRALDKNPNLQAAQASLKAAMETMAAQKGGYYPAVTAGLDASRNRDAAILSPALNSNALLYDLYRAQLAVSWTPDIWGANARAVEVLKAGADGQRFQLEAARVALTANLVAAAVTEASLKEQIDTTNAIITDEGKILDIERRQQAAGQIAGADVAAQETLLAQSQASLPPLQKQLAQEQDLLAALTGELPAEAEKTDFRLSSLTLPDKLPLSLPSKLAEQRADVRAAEENLHAASAQIGVTIAAQLPNITLSANLGSVATQIGKLFSDGFWNIGADVAQPVFDGGTLAHRTLAARASYDQAAALYRASVVGAFQNVADCLNAIESDGEAWKAAQAADQAAERGLGIARRQVALGQSGNLALLNAEQAERQARLAVIAAEATRLSDSAALFQALGGGWWNKQDES